MSVPAGFRLATVRGTSQPAEDARLIELVPPEPPVPYPLGSHIDIELIIDGRPVRRSYSLVGEGPHGNVYRICVKRLPDSRGGSVAMWALAPGSQLPISGPHAHFDLALGRAEYLLIAGGIGITPLYGMALSLARRDAPCRLLYAGRRRSLLPFIAELESKLDNRLELFISQEGRRLDLAAEIARLHADGELYICGPVALMEAAKRAWAEAGRPTERLRLETFGSSGHRPAEPFRVTVRDYGKTLDVAQHQSLIDALAAAGIDVASDCMRGECGICVVDVIAIDGAIDHRDIFLSNRQKEESARLCACVSRAVGHVTIDTGYRPSLRRS